MSPRNPYVFDCPVSNPSDFFGQEEILAQCWETAERECHYAIAGGPGSGKTSLLNQLWNPGARIQAPPSAENVLFVYLDCRLVPSSEAFLEQVARSILEQLPSSLADEYRGACTSEREFEDLIQCSPKKPILLMDNIDYITRHPHFPLDFFRYMRGIADLDMSIITTSNQSLKDCFSPDPACSDFWNKLAPLNLRPFTEEAVTALLTEQGRRSGISLLPYREEIETLAGRIPFFVQLACWHYFEASRDHTGPLSSSEHEYVRRQVAQGATPQFQRIWENLSADERKAAREIAQNGKVTMENAATAGLRQKGYIGQDRLFSPLFTEYVLTCSESTSP